MYNGYKKTAKELFDMESVRAYYDGHAFIPIKPIRVKKNQSAIVTILDERPVNRTKSALLALAGSFTEQDYEQITEALKDTERVDIDEW
jgi:hypothetical protein